MLDTCLPLFGSSLALARVCRADSRKKSRISQRGNPRLKGNVGVLDSDSYAGESIHQGQHQRCWVHCLWDVHEIKKQFPEDERLLTWGRNGKAIYDETATWAVQDPDPRILTPARSGSRVAVTRLRTAAQTPHQILCTYVERFFPELFVFVEIPAVPAHNNLVERSVCPSSLLTRSAADHIVPKAA
jgi:transposase